MDVLMGRPYVVCHMLTSLDGKIDGDFFSLPDCLPALRAYGRLRDTFQCQATLYGTTTMLGGYAKGRVGPLPEAAAPVSRKPRKGQADVEYRQDKGRAGHHVRVVRAADEKGVRDVVDQHDELAEYRGYGHRPHSPGYGHVFKEISVLFFCCHKSTSQRSDPYYSAVSFSFQAVIPSGSGDRRLSEKRAFPVGWGI